MGGKPDPTGRGAPTRGGVAITSTDGGRKAYFRVCNGNTVADWVGKTYSLNHGPNAYALKVGAYCADNPRIQLPPGVCIQLFGLWGGWGDYDNPNGWRDGLTCGGGCNPEGFYCGGQNGMGTN